MTKLLWLAIAVLPVLARSSPPAQRYSTPLGLVSTATGIAVDAAGYAYATGLTHPAFTPPCTLPVLGPTGAKAPYGYVSKIAPDGAVVWTACLGVPSGRAIAVDSSGTIYATGGTTVSKVSPQGDKIVFSIALLSADIDAIALDKAGNVYVGGLAQSGLATTPGAFLAACNVNVPCPRGFAAKFDPSGKIQYATYLGGTINSIAMDSHGAAWLTGTGVSSNSFGSYLFSFIDKLDAGGAHVLFSQGYGGDGAFHALDSAQGSGIAVDSNDNAYAVGQSSFRGIQSGYLLKIDSSGNSVYTNLGAAAIPSAVTVDSAARVYVGVYQTFHAGAVMNCGDAVTPSALTVYSSDGSTALTSAFQPGQSLAVAVDNGGNAYMLGRFFSTFYVTRYDTAENPAAHLDCLVNAASPPNGDGMVAAGELITLFGEGFQPGPELTILFDGISAPILYSSSNQINAVVPFKLDEIATRVSIQNGSQTIGPFELPVTAAVPRLFAVAGTQQALALNQDGSVNLSANPAVAGSVISVFLSGAGEFDQSLTDGQLGPMTGPFPVPRAGAVYGLIGDCCWQNALFAGQAPGQVAGLVQVNLRVPDETPTGPARIGVRVGDYFYTQGQIFIEVR